MITLTYGIPQGSVLGPIMFTLHTVPLGEICRKYGIAYQSYPDDQQMYISFKPRKHGAQEHSIQ